MGTVGSAGATPALRFGREIRLLFQTAMLLLVVTIGLGLARGLGLIDFDEENLSLTHLHSGALGWLTLGVLAAVLWLYGGTAPRRGGERYMSRTSLLLSGAVPLFVAAWWVHASAFLAIAGSLVFLGLLLYVAWLVREAAGIGFRNLTTPQLGAAVGMITLFLGSGIGVLIPLGDVAGASLLPGDPHGAHAEVQIEGYLVLAAMSLAYWRLHGDDRTRRGTWMVWLIFAGGAVVAFALLADVPQLAIAYVPLDTAAFVIFLTLAWRRVVAPEWLAAEARRHDAVAIAFGIVYLLTFVYVIVGFTVFGWWTDVDEIPDALFLAADHALFVGMVGNVLFGSLFDLDRASRSIWPWADDVLFWGMNVAAGAFTLALLFEADGLFKVITPVLGLSILVGILTHTLRLWSATPVAAGPKPHVAVAG